MIQAKALKFHAANALRDFEFIHSNRWNTHFVKNIAASRIDDGPGSKLSGVLIAEHDLRVRDPNCSIFRVSDLIGSFDHDLMERSTAVEKSLGTGRALKIANEERREHIYMAIKRFLFAIIGGLIIVVPMLILAVGNTPQKTLAVISTSIFVFAVGVAFSSEAQPENMLAITAAYAAVLTTLIGVGNADT